MYRGGYKNILNISGIWSGGFENLLKTAEIIKKKFDL